MSEIVTDLVYSLSESRGGARLVLLALAKEANDQGKASLSLVDLSRLTRLSVRGISNCLKELASLEELSHEKGGANKTNSYSILLGQESTTPVHSETEGLTPPPLDPHPGKRFHEPRSSSGPAESASWKSDAVKLEISSSRTRGGNTPYGSITTTKKQASSQASVTVSKRHQPDVVDVPATAHEVVAAMEGAGMLVGWRLSPAEWDRVTALSARWGAQRLVEVIARRWDPARPPQSARYLLRIWDDLPSQVPAEAAQGNVVPLRRESGAWKPYRNPAKPSAYQNGF
ncbi:hypothetical protein [Streptomyces sp. x-80]|uniref:hypothetical protein n=1 Tax=Streptomyces sp. x-80 TaxID=2789282 RepID=UPI0039809166